MNRLSRTLAAASACLLLSVGLAACGHSDKPSSQKSPTASTSPVSVLPPVPAPTLDLQALVAHASDAPSGFDVARAAQIVRGFVLAAVATDTGFYVLDLAAMHYFPLPDMTRGWSFSTSDQAAQSFFVDSASASVITVGGHRSGDQDAWTLRTYDATDGSPLSEQSDPVTTAHPAGAALPRATILGVAGKVVIVSVRATTAQRIPVWTTLALDLKTGQMLWRADAHAMTLHGSDVLLGNASATEPGPVSLVDATTGKALWKTHPKLRLSSFVGWSETAVMVDTNAALFTKDSHVLVLDPTTGAVLKTITVPAATLTCLPGTTTVVCNGPAATAMAFDLVQQSVLWKDGQFVAQVVRGDVGYGATTSFKQLLFNATDGTVSQTLSFNPLAVNGYGAIGVLDDKISFVPAKY